MLVLPTVKFQKENMNEVFKNNSIVESQLIEEPSLVVEDVLNTQILEECIKFAKTYVSFPDDFINAKNSWYRRGGVHRTAYIKDFSRQYIEPLLPRKDAILIGDTAFAIKWPPHDIHIDCRDFRAEPIESKDIISYKSVAVPLFVDSVRFPKLYTAEQYFYGPSTRFRHGAESLDLNDPEVERQKHCNVFFSYDYKADGVKYLKDNYTVDQLWYNEHIDVPEHTPYSTLKGLSIEKEIDWKPGNVIIFDSARIHFAENLIKAGGTHKIGLSLNYGVKIK